MAPCLQPLLFGNSFLFPGRSSYYGKMPRKKKTIPKKSEPAKKENARQAIPGFKQNRIKRLSAIVQKAEQARKGLENPQVSKRKKAILKNALSELTFSLRNGTPMTPQERAAVEAKAREISQALTNPSLTPGQKKAYEAIVKKAMRARNKIVESALKSNHAIAKKVYFTHESLCRIAGITIGDLIQEGAIGTIDATKRYNPERGTKFTSYAKGRAEGEMLSMLRDKAAHIRIPRNLFKKIQSEEALAKERARLMEAAENAPSEKKRLEAAKELAVLERLRKGIRPISGYSPAPNPKGSEKKTRFDTFFVKSRVEDPAKIVEARDSRQDFKKKLKSVLGNERKSQRGMYQVMVLRYLTKGKTLEFKEIATSLNISESRASQLHTSALELIASNSSLLKALGMGSRRKKFTLEQIRTRLVKAFK